MAHSGLPCMNHSTELEDITAKTLPSLAARRDALLESACGA